MIDSQDKNLLRLYQRIMLIPLITILAVGLQIYLLMNFFLNTKILWMGSSIISGIVIYCYIQIGFSIKKHYKLLKKH